MADFHTDQVSKHFKDIRGEKLPMAFFPFCLNLFTNEKKSEKPNSIETQRSIPSASEKSKSPASDINGRRMIQGLEKKSAMQVIEPLP